MKCPYCSQHTPASRHLDGAWPGGCGQLPRGYLKKQATVAWTRSLLVSYIEGQYLPHGDPWRIKSALETLNETDPDACRALERFHVEGDRSDPAGEAEAARRLAVVLASVSPRAEAA